MVLLSVLSETGSKAYRYPLVSSDSDEGVNTLLGYTSWWVVMIDGISWSATV